MRVPAVSAASALNFDFATLSFQAPRIGSAAYAGLAKNTVASTMSERTFFTLSPLNGCGMDFCCNALGCEPEPASEDARERAEDQQRSSLATGVDDRAVFGWDLAYSRAKSAVLKCTNSSSSRRGKCGFWLHT